MKNFKVGIKGVRGIHARKINISQNISARIFRTLETVTLCFENFAPTLVI